MTDRDDESSGNVSASVTNRLYDHILQSMPSGVVAVDGDGRIITANEAAARHLGLTARELATGTPFEQLDTVGPFVEAVRDMMLTQRPVYRQELTLKLPSGDRVLGFTASLLEGPDAFNGVIFLFTDLTEVRHLQRVARLNQQLAQIGELTAGVVHELRNPLSVISGMAELLARDASGDTAREKKIQSIANEAAALEKLISQFLSFARPFEVKPTRCTAGGILGQVIQSCARLAAASNVDLVLNPERDEEPLLADPEKLVQALGNLVRNAIEIQSMGGRVTVSTKREDTELWFRVDDEGPGLPEEVENLFDAFVSHKKGGTGLGLSIVNRIVSAHDGVVRCGNRPEGGAYFELRIPAGVI